MELLRRLLGIILLLILVTMLRVYYRERSSLEEKFSA